MCDVVSAVFRQRGVNMRIKSLLSIFVLLGAGCAQHTGNHGGPAPQLPEYFEHRVEYSGETFASIARWYTGASSNWTAIQASNPEIRPNRIKVGMNIKIPQELVTKTEKMPKPRTDRSAPVSSNSPRENDPSPVNENIETYPSAATVPSTEPDQALMVAPPSEAPGEPSAESANSYVPDPSTVAEIPPPTDSLANDPSQPPAEATNGVGSFLGALGKALAPSRGEGNP